MLPVFTELPADAKPGHGSLKADNLIHKVEKLV